jgi:hypothetical protein
MNERAAWELLALIDQIHLWAVTEFRTFILEHLRPWHTFCDDNYLLDWDSIYDTGPQRKRKRSYSEDQDLPLASWTSRLNEPARLKIQVRARESLARAIKEHQLRKGKAKCLDNSDSDNSEWQCTMDNCSSTRSNFESGEALLNHWRCAHAQPKWSLFSLRRLVEQVEEKRWRDILTTRFADQAPGPSEKRVRVH